MKTFLLPEEMAELKAIRSNYINDKQLKTFKSFLKKGGQTLTSDDKKNSAATWDIIRDHYTGKVFHQPNHENLTERFRNSNNGMNANQIIFEVLERITPDLYTQWQYVQNLRLNELKTILSNNLNNYLRKFCSVDFDFDFAGFILDENFDLSQYGLDKLNGESKRQTDAIFGVFDKLFADLLKPLNSEQRRIMQGNFPYLLDFYFKHPASDTTGKEYRDRINYINALSNE